MYAIPAVFVSALFVVFGLYMLVTFIFDAFFSTRRHVSCTGVGLTFGRRAVVLLGGSIKCSSMRGAHTTFTIRLPKPGTPADRAQPRTPTRFARRS
jgi:hypothetical protein